MPRRAARQDGHPLDSGELRTEELPARSLRVIPNPDMPSQTPLAQSDVESSRITWLGVGAAVLLLVLLYFAMQSGWGRRVLAPFRPVHLQPLNPTDE